jgi:hypothetical protein
MTYGEPEFLVDILTMTATLAVGRPFLGLEVAKHRNGPQGGIVPSVLVSTVNAGPPAKRAVE